MESDDENLVIALDHLNVDEALPDPEGAGDDEAPADVHKSETGIKIRRPKVQPGTHRPDSSTDRRNL